MPIPEDLQILYSLDTFSRDFSRRLYRLIQRDEKERYLTSLRGPELTKLVEFLDKVRAVLSPLISLRDKLRRPSVSSL